MAGISTVLNMAKQAIISHQVAIQVAGHNVANVDTPGYSRQTLDLTPALPNTSIIGPIGNGVDATSILRHYDKFAVERLMEQKANMGNLTAQQDSLRLVEAIFNESPGLAINELSSNFWEGWQKLADNPEQLATRQMVMQQSGLIINQMNTISNEIAQTRYDMSTSISTAISEVNGLTRQVADINVQITSQEADVRKANDLRDKRDELVKSLADLININYFENSNGAYTIMLPDGHALVDTNENWNLDWQDGSLQWLQTRINKTTLTEETVPTEIGSGEELGGKLGGSLEVYNLIAPNDPTNYSGRLENFANSFIREINQQYSQGVGMVRFSNELIGAEIAANTAVLTRAVDVAMSTQTIPEGSININGRSVGKIDGALPVQGIAMSKAMNAVTAINQAAAGVTAHLTTQVAGAAVTPMAAGNNGNVLSFSVNGVDVSYTVDVDGLAPDDDNAATLANNVASAINTAITAYNADTTKPNKVTIQAVVGDGTNGGAANSIILKNTNAGDDSSIVINGLDMATSEANLGLTNSTYVADRTHNTGEVTIFSINPFEVDGGVDDDYLDQLGWGGGGLSLEDTANDGKFNYSYADGGGIANCLMGYHYGEELVRDGGSFQVWVYNNDGTLAMGKPVEVSLSRCYTLQDVANAFNTSMNNAAGTATPWVQASISQDHLSLKPDDYHEFVFANDSSNFLATAGLNTFFTGYNASTMGINNVVKNDLYYLATGTVTDNGEIFRGDNSNALLLTNVQSKEDIAFIGAGNNTLDGYYNSLVGDIGIKGQNINRDFNFNELLLSKLNELRDETSGVSLDEEMSNLIQYQHAYTAAAKLITMADELMKTLLETV